MDQLPVELLEIILLSIPRTSLKDLSRVSRLFRVLCSPLIFQSIQVGITSAQLEGLLEISKSSYASFVRAIRYEATALLDPTEKEKVMQTSQDILLRSLPNLPNLQTLEINLVHGIKDQFGHASGCMIPYHDYYLSPLEKLLTAAVVAQENGVMIRAFHISGIYHLAAIEDCFLQALASKTFSDVEEIRVISTSAMFPFLSDLTLLKLRHLELIDIWLSLPTFERFIRQAVRLESVYLEDVWLIDELAGYAGGEFGVSKGLAISIVEVLARLGRPLEMTITHCGTTRRFVKSRGAVLQV
ncbi:hypothetical protein BDW69DRAFT_198674 [Aspergillus filifer]